MVAFLDLRDRKVPNWLVCMGLLCAGVSIAAGTSVPVVHLRSALLGFGIGFAVFLPLYAFGVMGAADVKVFATLGLWLGVPALLPMWLIASALAGLHAVYAYVRIHQPTLFVFGRAMGGSTVDAARVRGAPYAAFLVFAAVVLTVLRMRGWVAGWGGS